LRTSGCWYSQTTVLLVRDAVVPTPPESSRSTMLNTSSSVTGRPSTSDFTR
jgi:hypothetical protein